MDQNKTTVGELEEDKKIQEVERLRAKQHMRSKLRKRMASGSGVIRYRSNVNWAQRYLPPRDLLPVGNTPCILIALFIVAVGSRAMVEIMTLP